MRTSEPAVTEVFPAEADSTALALILPFELEPADVGQGSDDAWTRLGMMELTADRFRLAGLPVPPSESILVALRDRRFDSADARDVWLLDTFGAQMLVRGRLGRTPLGWQAELNADRAGTRYQVKTEGLDASAATRQAVTLLLEQMGESVPGGDMAGDTRHDRLRHAQAAVLASDYAQARSILEDLHRQDPNDPDVLYRLADLDAKEGWDDLALPRLESATTLFAAADHPVLSARIANLRGDLMLRQQDCVAGLRDYGMAASALQAFPVTREHAVALMGRGLAHTCLHDFTAAANDIGLARLHFEAIGDRAGSHRAEQYRGLLEMERGRPAEALSYLRNAADAYARLGDINQHVFGLTSLFDAHALLLQWEAAWEVSERGWSLRDDVKHPGQKQWLYVDRLRVLVAKGRLSEARGILAEARGMASDLDPILSRHLTLAAIELAWAEGDHRAVVTQATALRESGGDASPAYAEARVFLLAQRASILLGEPMPFRGVIASDADEESLPSSRTLVPLLAKAEWLAQAGDATAVDALYQDLIADADASGIPAVLVLVADSRSRWLIDQGRANEAAAMVGRIAPWSSVDFDSALAKLRVLHALGHRGAWSEALAILRQVAGERPLPSALLVSP